jgi:hypothetical protein
MRKPLQISLCSILLITGMTFPGALRATARPDGGDVFVGTWQGTWTGGSSGKFEMTFSKGAGGKLSGSISPKPDQGDGYTVEFKSVEVVSGKLTAKNEDPNGDVEITITGSAEGKAAKGTYSVKQKADGTEVDTGSWTATKK